ncbi:MAG: transketolase, partial [Bacilli bacterium]|nr:transketolase [Bacilli bacterium]
MNKKILELSIATIRALCIDETNKAKSGHPGMALGSAPLLYTLFTRHLVANPKQPSWFNRDRFVLSAGHASALLYAMLHLSGYDLPIEELMRFRQIDSRTPGHPEYHWTAGVDATSGPLGQGIAQAVGMAMAQQSVEANYPDGDKIHNHYTYSLCGDGCLQEGLSQEAISLAGHQKLNKLILFYDANQVTLDGALEMSFSENVKERFLASAWNVLEVKDGNDIETIDKAIVEAKRSKEKPTLIIVHTIIGFGSKKQGTSAVHGSPLGVEDGQHAKVEVYGFDHPDFYVPEEVRAHFQETFAARGLKAYEENQKALK